MSENLESTIEIGRYRHYKGGEYEVISVAKHSETRELLVVYRCLADNHSWWVRPLAMFIETVVIEGETIPRFSFIGSMAEDAR